MTPEEKIRARDNQVDAIEALVKSLRAEVARLTAEVERLRKFAYPADEHLCCGKYLGYATICPECGAECRCTACRAERA